VTVVRGVLATRDPATAAKVTRAILKGAKWVAVNPTAAAKISVDKKWLASTFDLNALAISTIHYEPSVTSARDSILQVAQALKAEGLLDAGTDPAALAKTAFMPFAGVTDEWINSVAIQPVANGGRYRVTDPKPLILTDLPNCCARNIQ
jgi:NitT/TauT family transport system substrate-binding protein